MSFHNLFFCEHLFSGSFLSTHAIFYRELSSFLWEMGEAPLDFAGGAFLAHEKLMNYMSIG